MRIGNMYIKNTSTNSPSMYGIKRKNFVNELTPWNYKEKGVCRISTNGPLYVYICRGELLGRKKDGRLYYCVRVFNGGEFNSDFTALMPALDYANCKTVSDLAGCSRLATEDEYPPDLAGLIGSYVVGGTILKHKATKISQPDTESVSMDDGKKKPCPSCRSFNVIPICYGYPVGDAMEKERRGEIELRGLCRRRKIASVMLQTMRHEVLINERKSSVHFLT